ncbi:hypothetical protein Q9Q94_10305 [Uliginosibacterium sp. 31-16]|uniref:hypothetical protein n=1 Tax=Uliginosibacterium sp. 31-16 TaxID=3068315 RepID=UPI00273FE9A5|nr:hypothetical protein [Uliginosibacterium sp. 31-16]MDP5239927.1 hypothetical protein [Uliginosibacterium sp. 31-16]
MPNLQKFQNAFQWGEISPRLLARSDLQQYERATSTMLNAYPLFHGGCTRRPGTTFIDEVYNSDQTCKLIPFVYNESIAYVLVFNGGKIEFIKNNTSSFVKNGANNYQLVCPYTEDDLPQLSYAQSGNTLFFAHPKYPPMQLQRVSDAVWLLTECEVTHRALTDYWYESGYISFKILSSSTKFVIGDKFTFTVTGGVCGVVTKTGTGNGTLVEISASDIAPNETWTITCVYSDSNRQEWSVSGSVTGSPHLKWSPNNYPAAVTFFEQRLWFAGAPLYPQTMWGSATGDYTTFTQGSLETDGIEFTIASNSYDQIRHLVSARNMLPLTFSGEFSAAGGTSGITPSSVKLQPQTFHGTSSVRPIRIGSEVIFLQRDMKKVRAISYSVTEDANVAPDLTMFAEHITGSGVIDMAFAQDPDYIAWMVRSDGQLISLTLSRDFQSTGWARHATDGLFENVVSLQNSKNDDVYFVVSRWINGILKRFIEKLDYTGIYTDSSKVVTAASPTKAFSGFNHLIGETVDVVADGHVHASRTVDATGSISLDYAARTVKVGTHYTTVIETLNPEFGDGGMGSTQGRALSITEIVLRVQDSINCRVNGHDHPFRTTAVPLGEAIPPFTGDFMVKATGWRKPQTIRIEQVTAQPFTLLGVIVKAAVAEV